MFNRELVLSTFLGLDLVQTNELVLDVSEDWLNLLLNNSYGNVCMVWMYFFNFYIDMCWFVNVEVIK